MRGSSRPASERYISLRDKQPTRIYNKTRVHLDQTHPNHFNPQTKRTPRAAEYCTFAIASEPVHMALKVSIVSLLASVSESAAGARLPVLALVDGSSVP
jgi:hypothetical protein